MQLRSPERSHHLRMRPAPSSATPANPARHQQHRPEETTLYRIVQSHPNTFLAFVDTETGGTGPPTFVTDEFDAFLACGILAHGFLRLACDGRSHALVPRPRLHLIRFHGVLAPNAKLRKAVVPVPPLVTAPAHASDCDHTPAGNGKGRMRWAQLLKRVFDIDVEHCPHCGGRLKLIAAIEDPAEIQRILTHLGLAAQPPSRAPAVRVDLFEAA